MKQVFITVAYFKLLYSSVCITVHKWRSSTQYLCGFVTRQLQGRGMLFENCCLSASSYLIWGSWQTPVTSKLFKKIAPTDWFDLKWFPLIFQLAPNCPHFCRSFLLSLWLWRILFQCPFPQQVLEATVLVHKIRTDSNVLPAINVILIV